MKDKPTPRLNPSIRRKMLLLLDMEYKPAELADQLGIRKETVRTYLYAGLPARKDAKGHTWIRGADFGAWAKAIMSTYEKRITLSENEYYCMCCHAPTTTDKHTRRKSGNRDMLKGICVKCGSSVQKFARQK